MNEAHDSPVVKTFWKRPLTIIGGMIGLIASSSTVVALVYGWFNPDTSQTQQQEKLAAIEKKLIESTENDQLVNQVSGRVSEISDRFGKLDGLLKDIRLLDAALSKQPKRSIVTPEQQKLAEASRKKELATLSDKLTQAQDLARQLVEAVEGDETLAKVQGQDSKPAQEKARIQQRAKLVRDQVLPELQTIQSRHSG